MAKQLNINLSFTAETDRAKQQISDLQQQLNSLSTGKAFNLDSNISKFTPEIQTAMKAAGDLQAKLEAAVNVDTGKINLTKFNASLKSSGKTLSQYAAELSAIGPVGSQAFLQLTRSIISAESPLISVNSKLRELGTSLKNTARWQISSSLLHGFMRTVASAYGYAEDLNKSLNNIRIVTGQSTEQMAQFAKTANSAARSLSTTTTKYTDAALIYYQQGLGDKEVKERTDATIKMANVAGENATEVSSYMTAIWNNFNKAGDQSAEHFGDVITKLGAETAASSAEIAGGLEKFAAVADTIGLSYDYATAALTTIIDKTRQSEDVVGTALKTIFARIQGLNLGNTLDDGTDLNKYSKALATVGISIKDSQGELKDMDTILGEMGSKWQTLNKDQQVALAQTVAGVRQYTQLVALMDNWDSFQNNLSIAQNSDGELNRQAEIYSESWEAARDRVRAAAEDIYDSLLNDKAFIGVLNAFKWMLNLVGQIVDGLGGMQGALFLVGSIATKIFSVQIANGLRNTVTTLKNLTPAGKKQAENENAEALNYIKGSVKRAQASENVTERSSGYAMQQEIDMQETMAKYGKNLTDEQRRKFEIQQQYVKSLQAEVGEGAKRVQQLKDEEKAIARKAEREKLQTVVTESSDRVKKATTKKARAKVVEDATSVMTAEELETYKTLGRKQQDEMLTNMLTRKSMDTYRAQESSRKTELERAGTYGTIADNFNTMGSRLKKNQEGQNNISQKAINAKEAGVLSRRVSDLGLDNLPKEIQNSLNFLQELEKEVDEVKGDFNKLDESKLDQVQEHTQKLSDYMTDLKREAMAAADEIRQLDENDDVTINRAAEEENVDLRQDSTNRQGGELNGQIEQQAQINLTDWSAKITSAANAAMNLGMVISSVQGIINTFNNPDATGWDKLVAVLTGVGMLIPALSTSISALGSSGILSALGLTTLAAATDGATVSVGALMLELLPIVAVLGIIIGLIYAISAASEEAAKNSPEAKLAAAEERAQNAKAAFDALTNSIEQTNTQLEQLANLADKAGDLKKGTLEWNEALIKSEEIISSLLAKYPELAGHVVYNNGIAGLDSEGEQIIKDANIQRSSAAALNILGANRDVAVEKVNGNIQKLRDNGSNYSYYKTTFTNGEQHKEQQLSSLAYSNLAEDGLNSLLETYNTYGSEIFNSLSSIEDAGNIQLLNDLAKDFYGQTWAALDDSAKNAMEQYLADQQKLLEDTAKNGYKVDDYNKQLSQQIVSGIGSTLNVEASEYKNNIKNYDEYIQKVKKDGWGTWHGITGLKDNETAQAALGGKFDKVQEGSDSDHVSITIGGEEKEYSYKELNDAIINYKATEYAQVDAYKAVRESLQNQGVSAKEIKALSDQQAVSMDNFYRSASDGAKEVVDTFGGIEKMAEATSHLTIDDSVVAQAKALADAMEGGVENVDNLVEAYKRLDAQAELEGMSSFFEEQAAAYGLSKDKTAELSAEMQAYAKHLMEVADESDLLSDDLTKDAYAAAKLSAEIIRMNKGIETLASGFDDWSDILKNSSKESQEYYDALTSLRAATADVLGVSGDSLSEAFLTDANNMDLLAKAAEGDGNAIDELKSKVDEEIILKVSAGKSEEVKAEIQNLDTQIEEMANELPDIEVGATLDTTEFVKAANDMVALSGMTADEVNDYYAGMGYEPVYRQEDIEAQTEMPNAKTITQVTDIGWGDSQKIDLGLLGEQEIRLPNFTTATRSVKEEPTSAESKFPLVSFSGERTPPPIAGFRKKASGSMNNSSSSNSGGGGSKKSSGGGGSSKSAKRQKTTKKKDIVERYKPVNDKLDDVKDALDDANKLADTLWGDKRFAAMEKENKALEKQAKLIKEKTKEAKNYLKTDKDALSRAGKELGINIKFDSNGLIANYEQAMNEAYRQLHDKEAYWANPKNFSSADAQSEYKEEKIDPLKEKVDNLKEAISQYDETRETIEDLDNELQDVYNTIKENNYKLSKEKLELKIEFKDSALKQIEYYIDKLQDDLYSAAEALSLVSTKQLNNQMGEMNDYIQYSADLDAQFKNGKITQKDYAEGLKEVNDKLLEGKKAYDEIDKTIKEYYSNTLDKAQEELSKYTDQLDHLTDVLEHYQNLVTLINGEKDFQTLGNILASTVKVREDQFNSSVANYQMLLKQQKELEDRLKKDPENEKWITALQAVRVAVNEAESTALEAAQSFIEAGKQLLENDFAKAANDMENALTNNLGFDALNNSFSRASSYQDEWLTKTNQMYETQKLLNQAQRDADKASSAAAKQQLANFAKETQALQKQTKLSNLELEIQQAKYKQLLAQIALEEAQNAKSTVRLQRDSEGNFGYVYTADTQKINEAKDALEEANHELYLIALKGINDSVQEISSLREKGTQDLTVLYKQFYIDGTISKEQFDQQSEDIINKTNLLIKIQEQKIKAAKAASPEADADAFVNELADQVLNAGDWVVETNKRWQSVKDSYEKYTDSIKNKTENALAILNSEDAALANISSMSDALAKVIIDKVVPANEKELNSVQELTDAYENLGKKKMESAIASADATIEKNNNTLKSMGEKEYTGVDTVKSISTIGQKMSGNDAEEELLNNKSNTSAVVSQVTATPSSAPSAIATQTITPVADNKIAVADAAIAATTTGVATTTTQSIPLSSALLQEIIHTIDSNAKQIISIENVIASTVKDGMVQSIEQQVHIDASFPNVSDRHEIEEAFNTLVNTASQYVNRK